MISHSKNILFNSFFYLGLFTLMLSNKSIAQPSPQQLLENIHYRQIGPTKQGGRVVSFAVSPQNPHLFYVAAGPGGVWKTENNGHTFTPVFDKQNIASIGDIAIAPSNQDIVWVGTGEANLRNSTYYGNGIYKSTDGAKTWEYMGLPESHHIGRVLIHPSNPDIVYVAAQGHYYSENSERGVYKTIDGGKTWERILSIEIGGKQIGATEIKLDQNNPNILYAVTYDRIRKPWMFRTSGPGSGIYKSTNAGKSWEQLTNGLPQGNSGKIGIDIYDKNTNILYATIPKEIVTKNKKIESIHEIYRSNDKGETWQQVSATGESIGERSNYYGQIIIDPNDEQHVFVLSPIVQESYDGGKTWEQNIRYGGDNHVLWVNPNNSKHLMMGYDYGMAISYDTGKNWYHPDELPMGQFYAISVDMDYPYNVYGGTQDFGSWKGPSTKKGRFPIRFEDWEHINGGDGFYNLVDSNDSRWLYSGSQFGHITKIDQQTGFRKTIMGDDNDSLRFNWNTPFLLSPHDSDVILLGAQKVLRSSDKGEHWKVISPDLTNYKENRKGFGPFLYGTITSISESPVQEGILWIGTDGGNVQLSRDEGKSWEKLNANIPNNPQYWVTRVTPSHHAAGCAYVAFSGLRRDDFRPFLYKTNDFGKTWEFISANLPNESINVIKEDFVNPNLLFVGTDKAVYTSLDGGNHWTKMKNNMPTVAVHDLVIHPREKDLVVGTHGRSIFIADISPLQELSPRVLEKGFHFFKIEPKVQWRMTSQPAISAQNFAGENEPFGLTFNYYLKDSSQHDITFKIYQGDTLINEVSGSNKVGINSVQWGMTKRQLRTPKEIAQWKKEQKILAEDIEFFDYYDTVEIFPLADQEVDKYGRSLQTRVHLQTDLTDKIYKYTRVRPGSYRVQLTFNGKVINNTAQILEDIWYDK